MSCNATNFSMRPGMAGATCNYCGSMRVADAIRLLKTPGVPFSGSDWKYGWPHKFYIDGGRGLVKFYNEHLKYCSDEEFNEFVSLSEVVFGVSFRREGEKLVYIAPPTSDTYGWQLSGTIGSDGLPNLDQHCFVDKVWMARFFEQTRKRSDK